MSQFFEAFVNMFRIPDLRKRLLFTLAMRDDGMSERTEVRESR